MNPVPAFLSRAARAGDKPAFIETDGTLSYGDWLDRVAALAPRILEARIAPGTPVLLHGNFNAASAAWLMALWQAGAVVAPVIPGDAERSAGCAEALRAAWIIDAAQDSMMPGPGGPTHALIDRLREAQQPGLVIFTSGTTGVPKAALHDLGRLFAKFEVPGKDLTTLAFLLFDHIAGIDTLLYCLANGSTIVCPDDRSPAAIAAQIAAHRVEVLPTAPSFLNLMMLAGAADTHDLSSLKIITYGAEMMPQPLLERLAETFPDLRIIQKYGTSEAGAPKARSESSTSRWLNFGVEEVDWRLRAGLLELPGTRAMLGYLNAAQPFSEDGWYMTGDRVERRGDHLRIIGRDSDVINVGGEKVFPAEIEAAIARVEGVAEVAVSGRPHPLMGTVVQAKIRAVDPAISGPELRAQVRAELSGRLEPYKIPQKIELTNETLVTTRFKQKR
ncbi:MAG: long-chain fatty acid--CoA ligase [Pseudomonadota bacterium]